MRRVVTSVMELVGFVAFTVGAWIELGVGVGLMVGGALCVLLGVMSA